MRCRPPSPLGSRFLPARREGGGIRYLWTVSTQGPTPEPTGEKLIARHHFEAVIRRAAELAMSEGEGEEEHFSQAEVVRIASELGLAPRHVRQALHELPALESPPSAFAGYFGSSVVSASRFVPGDADLTVRRLEEYLATREYLQLVRRKQGRLIFQPAEDTISLLARGLLRPSNRFQLARARKVVLTAGAMDGEGAHVQIAADLEDQRKSAVRSGIGFGASGGLMTALTGVGLAALGGLEPTAATGGLILTAILGGPIAGGWIGLKVAAAGFRRRFAAARLELDGLLDRAERGERLEPPAAPWRRRLELKMLGRHGGG